MKKIVGIMCLFISMLSQAAEPPKETISQNAKVAGVTIAGSAVGLGLAYVYPPIGIPWLILNQNGWMVVGSAVGAEAAHQYIANRPLFYSYKKPVVIENKNNEK